MSNNTQHKDQIYVREDLYTSLQNYDKIVRSIRAGTFFYYLYNVNKDIISHYYISPDKKTTTFFVKNLIDTEDEELGLICFTYNVEFHSTSLKITGHPSNDYDEAIASSSDIDPSKINVIYFQDFTIDINPDTLIFNMNYNHKKHPSYVALMIETYFKGIFNRFNDNLLSPNFLK